MFPREPAVQQSEPARIVLIEDNAADVTLVRYALDSQQEPYRLDVLTDGEQALQFVREYASNGGEPEPCVLLLDLHLPKNDGFEVLRAIRDAPALSNLRVVVF